MNVRLCKSGNPEETDAEFEIGDSGNKYWMPGKILLSKYTGSFEKIPSGKYHLLIQLLDEKSGRPVEIGLNSALKNAAGFYKIAEIKL
jgi:hypothetical protein